MGKPLLIEPLITKYTEDTPSGRQATEVKLIKCPIIRVKKTLLYSLMATNLRLTNTIDDYSEYG